MKSKLFFALTLSVLAANSFAADGFDRTGSAAAITRYDLTDTATVATDGHDHRDPTSIAAGDNDHTDSARTD